MTDKEPPQLHLPGWTPVVPSHIYHRGVANIHLIPGNDTSCLDVLALRRESRLNLIDLHEHLTGAADQMSTNGALWPHDEPLEETLRKFPHDLLYRWAESDEEAHRLMDPALNLYVAPYPFATPTYLTIDWSRYIGPPGIPSAAAAWHAEYAIEGGAMPHTTPVAFDARPPLWRDHLEASATGIALVVYEALQHTPGGLASIPDATQERNSEVLTRALSMIAPYTRDKD